MKKFFKIDSEGKVVNFFLPKKNKKEETYFRYFEYLGVGFSLISPIILGVFIGVLIKQIVFFIFLGMFLSIYNLFTISRK
jgi:F0F1-type ATP synthase assembly protein I